MTCLSVEGWLIDFRAARSIFASGSNKRISHCVDLCAAGRLRICHCEQDNFKSHDKLKPPFIDDNSCVIVPNDDILRKSLAIADSSVGKKLLRGNNAAIFLTAAAAVKNYGVISDHISESFSTVHDLCGYAGIPVCTVEQYFASI